jgi:hypothetical protein
VPHQKISKDPPLERKKGRMKEENVLVTVSFSGSVNMIET